jgi:hypothetical protein
MFIFAVIFIDYYIVSDGVSSQNAIVLGLLVKINCLLFSYYK